MPEGLSPVKAGLFPDALLKIAQQAADHVPAIRATQLDVALTVDADNTVFGDADPGQFLGVGAAALDEAKERVARHLNELHR